MFHINEYIYFSNSKNSEGENTFSICSALRSEYFWDITNLLNYSLPTNAYGVVGT